MKSAMTLSTHLIAAKCQNDTSKFAAETMNSYREHRNLFPKKGEVYITPELNITSNQEIRTATLRETKPTLFKQNETKTLYYQVGDKSKHETNSIASVSSSECSSSCASMTKYNKSSIRPSIKGFRLNDPKAFGRLQAERREEVDAEPILSNTDIFGVEEELTHDEENGRTGHYPGDNCVLHDPIYRQKQLLALQKYVNETNAMRNLAKSEKSFVNQACSAILPKYFGFSSKKRNLTLTEKDEDEIDGETEKIEYKNRRFRLPGIFKRKSRK